MFLSFWAGLLSAISSYCEATECVAARAEEEIAVTALLWWCVATSMASKCYVGHHHTFLPQAQATNGTKIPVCASHCGVNLQSGPPICTYVQQITSWLQCFANSLVVPAPDSDLMF